MPSPLARTVLFLSGYLPLFVIFAVQSFPKYRYWACLPLGVAFLATLGSWIFLRWVDSSAPRPITVRRVHRRDAEVVVYMFAFIFPFLHVDLEAGSNALGLGIFFVVLMTLIVTSNMIHINPTLNLFGWHLYEITLDGGIEHTLLTRRSRLLQGTHLEGVLLGDYFFVEKR